MNKLWNVHYVCVEGNIFDKFLGTCLVPLLLAAFGLLRTILSGTNLVTSRPEFEAWMGNRGSSDWANVVSQFPFVCKSC